MFELFIARRYLRAKRKQVVISVITAISVIGVAAGVMALVIALAINNGFRDTLQRNLLGATAHVSILEKQPGTGIEHWEDMAPKLARIPGINSPAISSNASRRTCLPCSKTRGAPNGNGSRSCWRMTMRGCPRR